MKFSGMLLVVKDMDRSRRFYTDVLGQRVFLDLETYVEFGPFCLITEPQWLEFQDRKDLPYRYENNVCQLAFEEEDMDGFLRHLATFPDIEIMCVLKEYEWGQRSIRFYDPDRHIVEVGEDMKVVTKRFLQSGMTVEEACARTMLPHEYVHQCFLELSGE